MLSSVYCASCAINKLEYRIPNLRMRATLRRIYYMKVYTGFTH
jgi:hypothetical protein